MVEQELFVCCGMDEFRKAGSFGDIHRKSNLDT